VRYRHIGEDPDTRREVSVLCFGAMLLGTAVDEPASFALLDRFTAAGGTFIDTANNYAFWLTGSQGGESEALLGRWRQSRGITDEVIIATKLGARVRRPATTFEEAARLENVEGLSAATIPASARRSLQALGLERLDLLYAHLDDPATPLAETVETFGALVDEGTVGLLGVSNQWSWRVEQARTLARQARVPAYEVLQYHFTYLRPRTDFPGRRSPDGEPGVAAGEVLSYLRAHPSLTAVVYSPLLRGAYVRDDKPLGPEYDHPGTSARMDALRDVARQTGATLNQVVLAWLMGGDIPMIPLVSASTVGQLDESLEAVDLGLTPEQRARLDDAR
jgi:aryl-alcohol dehydrogenase-like predicted oxidoreductase